MVVFKDMNEVMAFLSRSLADIRGEALAGQFLGLLAIDLVLKRSPDRQAVLDELSVEADAAFDSLIVQGGTVALDERIREVARLRCHEMMSEIHRRWGLDYRG